MGYSGLRPKWCKWGIQALGLINVHGVFNACLEGPSHSMWRCGGQLLYWRQCVWSAPVNAGQAGYPQLQNQPWEPIMVCFRTLTSSCSSSAITRSGCSMSWAPTAHASSGGDGNPPSSRPMFQLWGAVWPRTQVTAARNCISWRLIHSLMKTMQPIMADF
jgi:hypothetical protein